ncbi:MAG: hypothetical protein A2X22_00920 [Bacteroidetes bacterium GWF2_49_14]|nr:MAG: hypothetical protein A2X22_00920 [Bacteroidetes bacterium GWF2_49_14]HBB90161.1 efflux RND transporter periplasmic adaptor subunit [Bacteroidales bacterium]
MKKLLILLVCLISLFSCKPKGQKNDNSPNLDVTSSGDTIIIPVESAVGKKIKLLTLHPEPVVRSCSTTGTIRAIPECIADIAVPFDGRIVESFVKTGQSVRAGTPLFSIHSPVFFETVKTYQQARQEKQVAELNFRRHQDLVDKGVGIQKELDEARLQYEIAKGQVENLAATLSIYNVSGEEIEVGKPMVVRSPIKGEIVRSTIRIGQYLTADSDPMVCVADLKNIWVIAQLKEDMIGQVKDQDEVSITINAYPDQSFTGFVRYIGKILDEQTRSLEVIIDCQNQNQLLKPGMFATVTFSNAHDEGILLPATALIQDEDHTFVVKSLGVDRYLKTEVEIISAPDGKVIAISGIQAGETIVSDGSIYLQ